MAIQELRLPNGEAVVFDEWSHWPRYSTCEVAAAQAGTFSLDLFSYVVGGRVPTAGVAPRIATPSDTNQVAKKRMNQDEAFLAYAWTYEIFALTGETIATDPVTTLAQAPVFTATNHRRLQRDVMVSLIAGAQIKKPVARVPLTKIGQGVGSPAYGSPQAIAADVSVNHGTGGRATPANQATWNMPIYIGEDRVFYAQVKGVRSPTGGTPALDAVTQSFQFKLYLDGLHRRPIA